MFPGEKGNGLLSIDDLRQFWVKARDAVGIVVAARLCKLGHAHDSHAVTGDESQNVICCLPRHCRASPMYRYVCLDDVTLNHVTE